MRRRIANVLADWFGWGRVLSKRRPSRYRVARSARVAVIMLGLLVAACGGTKQGVVLTSNVSSYSGGSLSVFTDTIRLPGFKLFEKTHPNVHLNLQIEPNTSVAPVIDLDNKAGKGWPDIVWDPDTTNVTWSQSSLSDHFAANITKLVPKSMVKKFYKGGMYVCEKGGKLYCLRNDIAANVLWYNPALMKQFGYTLPTTWQQYEALGLKVAKQHPGYVVGADGDGYAQDIFLWGAQCSLHKLTGPKSVSVELNSKNCTKIFNIMTKLENAGSLSTEASTDPGFIKKYASKVLMMPGPNWDGLSLMKQTWGTPDGVLAAAPMVKWAGEKGPYDGDVGGGVYYISRHLNAAQKKEAVKVIEFMATNPQWQTSSVTFPAYAPNDALWIKNNAGHWFAQSTASITQVMDESANNVWTGWPYVPFNEYYPQFVLQAYHNHEPITKVAPAWAQAEAGSAQSFGYQATIKASS